MSCSLKQLKIRVIWRMTPVRSAVFPIIVKPIEPDKDHLKGQETFTSVLC